MLAGENVKTIYVDKADNIWAGTERNGLMMSSDGGKNWTNFINNKNDPFHQAATNIIHYSGP